MMSNFPEHWHSLFRRIAIFVFVLATTHPLCVSASTAPSPTITLGVGNPLGNETTLVKANGLPYFFGGTALWPTGARSSWPWPWTTGVDIYFGLVLPDRSKVLTWAPSNGSIVLNEGLVPFVRAWISGDFNTGSGLASPIGYTFSGSEPAGMYLLFLLLVGPGDDPMNPANWRAVGMQPFFF